MLGGGPPFMVLGADVTHPMGGAAAISGEHAQSVAAVVGSMDQVRSGGYPAKPSDPGRARSQRQARTHIVHVPMPAPRGVLPQPATAIPDAPSCSCLALGQGSPSTDVAQLCCRPHFTFVCMLLCCNITHT